MKTYTLRLPRGGGEPSSATNYFLIFVADSPRVRHSCEKFATQFENLQTLSILISDVIL